MLSILKSDVTWFPESSDGVVFKLRANKDINLKSRDFELYDTGLNLDFSHKENIVFEVLECHRNIIQLKNNIMKQNNYLETKSKIVTMINISNDDIYIKETEFILTFRLESKEIIEKLTNTSGSVTVAEPVASTTEEPVASTVEEPVASTVDEPVASTVDEPVASTTEEPVASTVDEPVASTVDETTPITSLDAPKKRKYIRKK